MENSLQGLWSRKKHWQFFEDGFYLFIYFKHKISQFLSARYQTREAGDQNSCVNIYWQNWRARRKCIGSGSRNIHLGNNIEMLLWHVGDGTKKAKACQKLNLVRNLKNNKKQLLQVCWSEKENKRKYTLQFARLIRRYPDDWHGKSWCTQQFFGLSFPW